MNEFEIAKTLRAAIKSGDIQKVRSLVADSANTLHYMTPFGTWLHVAAKSGNLDIVRMLISLGADVNARGGTFGGTPINLAASYGQPQIVRTLLAAGAELDVDKPEKNPLFGAIQCGQQEIVEILVASGIDFRVRYTGESMKNMDAEAFARECGQTDIANYLAELKTRMAPKSALMP
jgi:ankyrin repeat protein